MVKPTNDIRPLSDTISEVQVSEVCKAILAKGNVCKAAKELHLHRNTLYRILKRAGLPLKTGELLREIRRQKKLTFAPLGRQT